MAMEFDLTNGPVKLSGSFPQSQSLNGVLDVSKVDQVDLLCMLLANNGAAGGPTIEIWTGMSADSETGWESLGSFDATALNTNRQVLKNFKGLLKYLRWTVVASGGANPLVFSIRGMGRLN